MQIKNLAPTRKALYVLMLLGLVFSAFSAGSLTPAYAQDGGTDTPATEVPVQETPTPEPITDGQATATPEPATSIPMPKKIESQSIEPQIIGGALADPSEYPWQVRLNISMSGSSYLCGGSLIHPQWVLTAAHCITTDSGGVVAPSGVTVYAGEYAKDGSYGHVSLGAIQVIRHPSYNDYTLDSDVALIKLSETVTVGDGSNPPYTKIAVVPLVPASIGSLAGSNVWVTGWGKTSYGGNTSNILREVQLPVMAEAVCNDYYHWGGEVTSNMICAGYDPGGYQSTCQGDSGGPAVVWNSSTSQWNLAGVVSFGPVGCAVPYAPSVFTRVSQFGSWINGYILDPVVLSFPLQSDDLGTDYNPDYEWNKVDEADEYRVFVYGPNGVVIDQWYKTLSVCDAITPTCSVNLGPNFTLAGGNHYWKVMPGNAAGSGSWSTSAYFKTTVPLAPVAPNLGDALTLPLNNADLGTNYTPTFRWKKVSNATQYYLYVTGQSGVAISKWVMADACGADSCSVVSPVTLGGGNFSWQLLAWNPAGSAPWSSVSYFKTTVQTAPVAPNLGDALTLPLNNADLGTNYTPTFRWKKVANATQYYLYVTGQSGVAISKWVMADACGVDSCSVVSPVTLGGGNFSWQLLAWNPAGSAPWSSVSYFKTTALTAPIAPNLGDALTLPLNNADLGTNYTPTFRWKKVSNATQYYLYVTGQSGVAISKWVMADACGADSCSVVSPVTLGGGNFSWQLLAWNPAGSAPWSSVSYFKTTALTAPVAPNLGDALTLPLNNADLGTNYTPTFRWKKVANATQYYLYVTGQSGVAISKWIMSVGACGVDSCSVTSPVTLGGGNFSWQLLAWNPAGSAPWSSVSYFKTTVPAAPLAPDLSDPITYPQNMQNLATTYNPTYTWKKVSGAAQYRLIVTGPSGTVLDSWYPAADICIAETCSVVSPTLSGGTYYWTASSWNTTGTSVLPPRVVFYTDTMVIPGGATNLSLTGALPYTPTYTWTKVPMAVWYRLYVKGPDGVVLDSWYRSVDKCNNATCSVSGPTLAKGDYTWWVQTYNPVGYGSWRTATFTVSP